VNVTTIHNLFESILLIVSTLIAGRAFFFCRQIGGERLFIIGLAMGIIALTSVAGLVGDNALLGIHYNTNWFKYIGQAVSILFIFLSAIRSADNYLYYLLRAQIAISALLLLLLIITPMLPHFSDPTTEAIVSGSRALTSLLAFYGYMSLFMGKETRYTLLMSVAFLLLTFGYIFILPPLFVPHLDMLSNTGNILRIVGLSMLLLAFLCG
jgi:hypothetical protein